MQSNIYSRGLFAEEADSRFAGYGTGQDGFVTYTASAHVGTVQGREITVNAGVYLFPLGRLQPIVLKATRKITINGGLDAAGYGMISSDADNNRFGLAQSSWLQRGSIGISGGGFTCPGGSCGLQDPGGRAVAPETFLNYIRQYYKNLLCYNDYSIIPMFGGGGGGSNEVPDQLGPGFQAGHGGGAVILCAPEIEINGWIHAHGQAGRGSYSYHGYGGGGGGWIGLFGRSLKFGSGAELSAPGGGGGGYYPGSWATGGTSINTPQKYSRGGGGGGSTALNAHGGTPGAGGAGAQSQGYNGRTTGEGGGGGGGGDGYGSKKGTGGGAGGGAGKISWLQIND